MQLTPHFTLAELTASTTAQRLGLDNTPSAAIVQRLGDLAKILERVRQYLGKPIIVTSGYRSLAVNKAVGGGAFPFSPSVCWCFPSKISARTRRHPGAGTDGLCIGHL